MSGNGDCKRHDSREERDLWPVESRDHVQAKIRRGMDQLDRGEGIPEAQLDAYLARLKSQGE